MPSPFPGMDPYLEHPALFPGVHQGLIAVARATLNTLLPKHYVADIGERVYIVQPERSIYPDVVVLEYPIAKPPAERSATGTAAATASDPPWVVTYHPVEMREVFIEILSVRDESRVITVIEVLSPSNKAAGSAGRQLYLTKQQELFESPTHLLEIDLLRRGLRPLAHPRVPESAYVIALTRAQSGATAIWPLGLRDPLPEIPVPLREPDGDVLLELGSALAAIYDEAGYDLSIDYTQSPPPPQLNEIDAAWIRQLLG